MKPGLIPRYNWDYDIASLISSLVSSSRNMPPGDGLTQVFGATPLYTTSGRASLYSLLKGLHLPEGSSVGVPLFCCSVVFDAIRQAGCRPLFLDINPLTYTIAPEDLDRKKNNLSAVVVVHMFGHPADMQSILDICGQIPVIEDCAQSLFSRYRNRYTGFLSTASFFSFRSGKYLSVGEGSAIFCQDKSLDASVRSIINEFPSYSRGEEIVRSCSTFIKSTLYHRPWYGLFGFPIGRKLDAKLNLSAKSGFSLKQIDRNDLTLIGERITSFRPLIEKQREYARFMLTNLRLDNIILPWEQGDVVSTYFQFAIRFRTSEERDYVAQHLFERGIDTAKYLDDIIETAHDSYDYSSGCREAEHCSRTNLCIPNYYTLSSHDIVHIVEILNSICKK